MKRQLLVFAIMLIPMFSMGQKCKVQTSKGPNGAIVKKTREKVIVASMGYEVGLTDREGVVMLHWRMRDNQNVYVEKDNGLTFTLEDGSSATVFPDDIYEAYEGRDGWYHEVNYLIKPEAMEKISNLKITGFKVELSGNTIEETLEAKSQAVLLNLAKCL